MLTELQQEQASFYVLGTLSPPEREAFEAELRVKPELQALVRSLQHATGLLAMACPPATPPPDLRDRILRRIATLDDDSAAATPPVRTTIPGFQFIRGGDPADWKPLPVPGAFVKLLSLDRERGYAVLMGRLEPGTRYPAHTHTGAEDLFLLSGDLHIGDRVMKPGDFHHSDAGTSHDVNYSVEGCTLLAVLSVDHALAKFAMA